MLGFCLAAKEKNDTAPIRRHRRPHKYLRLGQIDGFVMHRDQVKLFASQD
jgi:hypothetical protein